MFLYIYLKSYKLKKIFKNPEKMLKILSFKKWRGGDII